MIPIEIVGQMIQIDGQSINLIRVTKKFEVIAD